MSTERTPTASRLLRPALALLIALAIAVPAAAGAAGRASVRQDPADGTDGTADARDDQRPGDPIGPAGPERPRNQPPQPLPDAGDEPEGPVDDDDPFGAAGARQETQGGGRLWLSTSLELGAAHDTGVETDSIEGGGGEEIGETAYRALPTVLLLARPSERTEFSVGYQPEIERFEDRAELDAVHHAAGTLYRYTPSERSLIQAGVSWLDGEDPSRHLDGLVLLLPRTPYRQGRAHLDLERRWQRTALRFHVARTDTLIEPAGELLPVGVDQTDDVAALGLEWAASRRTTLTANYSWVDTHQDRELLDDGEGEGGAAGELPPPITEPVQILLLGFSREMSRRVVLDLAAGWLRQERSELERAAGLDDGSWIASGEIRRVGDLLSLRLRYDHSLLSLGPSAGSGPVTGAPGTGSPVPTGALRDSVAHTVTFSFELQPAPWLRWQQRLWGTRAELDGGDRLDALAATTRLVFPVADRFGLYGRLDYFDQDGFDFAETGVGAAGDLSRTRVSAGLIVGLGGPPSTWGLREEPTLLLRTLRPGLD